MTGRLLSKKEVGTVKRLTLAITLACITALVPGLVLNGSQASSQGVGAGKATHTYSRHQGASTLLEQSRSPLSPTRYALPARPQVWTVQGAGQLRLPPSAFPDGSQVMADHSLTPTEADDFLFSGLHMSQYEALHAGGAWYQYYAQVLQYGTIDLAYLGTYYPTDADALRAFDDVRTNPHWTRGWHCSAATQCFEDSLEIDFSDGPYIGSFRVVQRGNAVAEIFSMVPVVYGPQYLGVVEPNLDRATTAFLSAAGPEATSTPRPTATLAPTATPLPTNTPTPTSTPIPTATTIPLDFALLSVRAEKSGAKPDFELNRAPIKKLAVGAKASLSIYVVVRSAPSGTTVQFEQLLTRAGKTMLHKSSGQPVTTTGPQTYRGTVGYTFKSAGTYRFKGSITIGGITKTKTTNIQVK